MIELTATQLRHDLFTVLSEVESGTEVVIVRNGRAVARLTGITARDWRESMRETPQLNGSPEEVFAPLETEWAAYR